MTAIRRARELLPAESLGADNAAPSNCFESIPGGTRFVVSKLQPQVSRGTGCPSCGRLYLCADAIRPLPVIRHAGELALLGLPLLLLVPGYLRFFLGIGIIDQRHVFFCSAANKGDATRQQQQKGNRSFRNSNQHK
jgi:hypothetical protein